MTRAEADDIARRATALTRLNKREAEALEAAYRVDGAQRAAATDKAAAQFPRDYKDFLTAQSRFEHARANWLLPRGESVAGSSAARVVRVGEEVRSVLGGRPVGAGRGDAAGTVEQAEANVGAARAQWHAAGRAVEATGAVRDAVRAKLDEAAATRSPGEDGYRAAYDEANVDHQTALAARDGAARRYLANARTHADMTRAEADDIARRATATRKFLDAQRVRDAQEGEAERARTLHDANAALDRLDAAAARSKAAWAASRRVLDSRADALAGAERGLDTANGPERDAYQAAYDEAFVDHQQALAGHDVAYQNHLADLAAASRAHTRLTEVEDSVTRGMMSPAKGTGKGKAAYNSYDSAHAKAANEYWSDRVTRAEQDLIVKGRAYRDAATAAAASRTRLDEGVRGPDGDTVPTVTRYDEGGAHPTRQHDAPVRTARRLIDAHRAAVEREAVAQAEHQAAAKDLAAARANARRAAAEHGTPAGAPKAKSYGEAVNAHEEAAQALQGAVMARRIAEEGLRAGGVPVHRRYQLAYAEPGRATPAERQALAGAYDGAAAEHDSALARVRQTQEAVAAQEGTLKAVAGDPAVAAAAARLAEAKTAHATAKAALATSREHVAAVASASRLRAAAQREHQAAVAAADAAGARLKGAERDYQQAVDASPQVSQAARGLDDARTAEAAATGDLAAAGARRDSAEQALGEAGVPVRYRYDPHTGSGDVRALTDAYDRAAAKQRRLAATYRQAQTDLAAAQRRSGPAVADARNDLAAAERHLAEVRQRYPWLAGDRDLPFSRNPATDQEATRAFEAADQQVRAARTKLSDVMWGPRPVGRPQPHADAMKSAQHTFDSAARELADAVAFRKAAEIALRRAGGKVDTDFDLRGADAAVRDLWKSHQAVKQAQNDAASRLKLAADYLTAAREERARIDDLRAKIEAGPVVTSRRTPAAADADAAAAAQADRPEPRKTAPDPAGAKPESPQPKPEAAQPRAQAPKGKGTDADAPVRTSQEPASAVDTGRPVDAAQDQTHPQPDQAPVPVQSTHPAAEAEVRGTGHEADEAEPASASRSAQDGQAGPAGHAGEQDPVSTGAHREDPQVGGEDSAPRSPVRTDPAAEGAEAAPHGSRQEAGPATADADGPAPQTNAVTQRADLWVAYRDYEAMSNRLAGTERALFSSQEAATGPAWAFGAGLMGGGPVPLAPAPEPDGATVAQPAASASGEPAPAAAQPAGPASGEPPAAPTEPATPAPAPTAAPSAPPQSSPQQPAPAGAESAAMPTTKPTAPIAGASAPTAEPVAAAPAGDPSPANTPQATTPQTPAATEPRAPVIEPGANGTFTVTLPNHLLDRLGQEIGAGHNEHATSIVSQLGADLRDRGAVVGADAQGATVTVDVSSAKYQVPGIVIAQGLANDLQSKVDFHMPALTLTLCN